MILILNKKQWSIIGNMEDRNIKKYQELEEEYFSSCPNWTYEWRIDSVIFMLNYDFENKKYNYSVGDKYIRSFKDIYEALDGVVINGKTLKQLLLETDFDFYSIN